MSRTANRPKPPPLQSSMRRTTSPARHWATSLALMAGLACAQAPVPSHVAEAVQHMAQSLSPTQRGIVMDMGEDDVFTLLGEWGDDVIQDFRLAQDNAALRQAACGRECPAHEAALALMRATWRALHR